MNLIAEFIGGELHGQRRTLSIGQWWFYHRSGSVIDSYERLPNWYWALRVFYVWRHRTVLPEPGVSEEVDRVQQWA